MFDWYPMNTGDHFPLGNETIHGTCSCCGGPVCTPTAYWSLVPPVPTCKRCGAKRHENYGPVIDMVPPRGKMVGQWPHVEWQVKKEDLPTVVPDISLDKIRKMYDNWKCPLTGVSLTGTHFATNCPVEAT